MALRRAGSKPGHAAAESRPAKRTQDAGAPAGVETISSQLSYEGPLFNVYTDYIRENGREVRRDVVRHNGSVVILAVDDAQSKDDPTIILERQYRHAARESLLELPAGKLEKDEDHLTGAKRELLEETGYKARRWRKLVRYFASPGFLGEWMQVYVAEGLSRGEAEPEYDEQIELVHLPLSKVLALIEAGKVHDGKTLIGVMLYDRLRRQERRKAGK